MKAVEIDFHGRFILIDIELASGNSLKHLPEMEGRYFVSAGCREREITKEEADGICNFEEKTILRSGRPAYFLKENVEDKIKDIFSRKSLLEIYKEEETKKEEEHELKRIENIFLVAKSTNEKQVLFTNHYLDNNEGDVVSVTTYAMPDGTKETLKSHNY